MKIKTTEKKTLPQKAQETVPLILESNANKDYALIDSGHGKKLERYGPYLLIRPESQAMWQPSLDKHIWRKADAVFQANSQEEGIGSWSFPHSSVSGETWPLSWNGLSFLGRFTSFRHVGVFPEQEAHWRFIENLIMGNKRPLQILNLFAYTGLASLIAARAGAKVTHLDASRKAIRWAQENQKAASLLDKPIRWICDDAMKFVLREERRGKNYDIILLDPPAYGRGPRREIWQIFEHLPEIISSCRALLSPNPLAVIMTTYSIRLSSYAIHELMRDIFSHLGGKIESGELILREKETNRALSTSLFSRWVV
ncbi:MAG: 23S rRNA (cytosine1962-C5)-methyltransferase [Candidatus Tokpelaia sp. JSC161]|jgi:23S rRNA (cytosine1962-C5)-methyltransferase|nr:MAG: 23S rRNA (cytosine1962-C5)-methyltransferase [Candidatus Tokpelaia sp. JSC161]